MSPDVVQLLIAIGIAVAGIVVWAYATFQTKENGLHMWEKLETMSQTMGRTAEDVAYIKGKLEPKED